VRVLIVSMAGVYEKDACGGVINVMVGVRENDFFWIGCVSDTKVCASIRPVAKVALNLC
jgi:hypothetical protein